MATKGTESEFDPQELRREAIERLRGRHGKVVDMSTADLAIFHSLSGETHSESSRYNGD
jgi:hypothetical protein